MNQTKAPKSTPPPSKGDKQAQSNSSESKSQSAIFVSLALDMSWRLAIVVLVPIIGGFELDKKFNTSPLLIISGFILAMFGMALVLWRMLQFVNSMPTSKKENHS